MKALLYFGPKDLRFTDIPKPSIAPDEILMKVKEIGICGTDLHIYSGGMKVPTPLVMGHEFVGEVVEAGSGVKNVKVHDRVVAEHVIGCGKCIYCNQGLKNLCKSPVVIGLHRSGALAEFLSIPANLVFPIPNDLSYDDGVLVEPLSIAVYAMKRAGITKPCNVAVVGQGPIGIFVDQVAKAMGCKVYGFDINDARLAYSQKMGFIDAGLNTGSASYMQDFQKVLGTDGADVVFEVVGREETAQISLNLAKSRGKVVILGVFEHDVSLNMMQIVKKELQVLGSWTCLDSFAETIELIKSKDIDTSTLITHRYTFDNAIKAFEEAFDTSTNRIKSIIEFSN